MEKQSSSKIYLNGGLKKPIGLSLRKFITFTIILILLASNFYFGFKYFNLKRELEEAKIGLQMQKINDEILGFTKLFIEKVLKAETEVDFETRLKLENAVRNLGDEEILAQWQKFTESKTEVQAQEEVKILLEILVSKIKVQ